MSLKILIVEDDPHILLGLEEVLRSESFEVAVCNRGDQALAAFDKHHPDLVVLDGDPARDVRAFARVRYTVRAGRVIYGSRSPAGH